MGSVGGTYNALEVTDGTSYVLLDKEFGLSDSLGLLGYNPNALDHVLDVNHLLL